MTNVNFDCYGAFNELSEITKYHLCSISYVWTMIGFSRWQCVPHVGLYIATERDTLYYPDSLGWLHAKLPIHLLSVHRSFHSGTRRGRQTSSVAFYGDADFTKHDPNRRGTISRARARDSTAADDTIGPGVLGESCAHALTARFIRALWFMEGPRRVKQSVKLWMRFFHANSYLRSVLYRAYRPIRCR